MKTNSSITPECSALFERVMRVKSTYRLTYPQIAEAAGMGRSTINNQFNGHFNIDVRVLLALARMCPDLSFDWLIRGEGDMFVKKSETSAILERIADLENKLNINN